MDKADADAFVAKLATQPEVLLEFIASEEMTLAGISVGTITYAAGLLFPSG